MLPEVGDLLFSLFISYVSALEFLYVVRHLYHWSFRHDDAVAAAPAAAGGNESDGLARLQEHMRSKLAEAEGREVAVGAKAMQDGVPYKDGFRIDPHQKEIDSLKARVRAAQDTEDRRQTLETELAKQRKIEGETRKELAAAEARYAHQQRLAEEERLRKLLEAERERERAAQRRSEETQASRDAEAEAARRLLEAERAREGAQRAEEEAQELRDEKEDTENSRRLLEAERAREGAQRAEEEAKELRDEKEDTENSRRLLEAERAFENEQRILEAEEEIRKLLEDKSEKEEQQQHREEDEGRQSREAADRSSKRDDGASKEREPPGAEPESHPADELAELTESEKRFIEEIKQREAEKTRLTGADEGEEDEIIRRILEAQIVFEGGEPEEAGASAPVDTEQDWELKQRRIEDNARLFMEAEREMVELQQQIQEAVQERVLAPSMEGTPQTPVVEPLCVKKFVAPLTTDDDDQPLPAPTVKTQLGQTYDEPYSVTSKPLLFPEVSDDGSSDVGAEAGSSKQPSSSPQPPEPVTTLDSEEAPHTRTTLQFPQLERQGLEGEDSAPSVQYSEEYLRSLDGIKHKPHSREVGSGRRRAFKKHRSNGSSNSSRDSKTSHDEEVKMFASLEEGGAHKGAESDFPTPIQSASEPNLKVSTHRSRRKRSPAKDARTVDSSLLERLGEEGTDPWGEVVPEHYKDMEFWQREKALSIDEEDLGLEKPISSDELTSDSASNVPSASVFKEASPSQNQEALSDLSKQRTDQGTDEETGARARADNELESGNKTHPQDPPPLAQKASSARSAASFRLQRGLHVTEIDPDLDMDASKSTPTISIHEAVEQDSWRDEYGLLRAGLSDFYDFTASVNPSRSRSTSRSPQPSPPRPPKDLSYNYSNCSNRSLADVPNDVVAYDVYDDTDSFDQAEFRKEDIVTLLDSVNKENGPPVPGNQYKLHFVADDLRNAELVEEGRLEIVPAVNVVQELAEGLDTARATRHASRSRSSSPLPTTENVQRSLEARRHKRIEHNEDVLAKLVKSKLLPEEEFPSESVTKSGDESVECSEEKISSLIESLCLSRNQSRSPSPSNSRSCSRSHSPLPTADDVPRSLGAPSDLSSSSDAPLISVDLAEQDQKLSLKDEDYSRGNMCGLVEPLRTSRSRSRSRSPMPTTGNSKPGPGPQREKLTERNDEVIQKPVGREETPEPPRLTIECVHEDVPSKQKSDVSIDSTERSTSSSLPILVTDSEMAGSVTPVRTLAPPPADQGRSSTDLGSQNDNQSPKETDERIVLEVKTTSKEIETKSPAPSLDNVSETSGRQNKDPTATSRHLSIDSPLTPELDRSISEEWKETQRLKRKILTSGFKRSTYAGESMDLGSEFEDLRREAAKFQRSRSPSPMFGGSEVEQEELSAVEKRKLQENILAELRTNSTNPKDNEESDFRGAKSKKSIRRPSEGGGSKSTSSDFEEMRRQNAEFRRSASKSRSPLPESELHKLVGIEAEVIKRELRDQVLDEIAGIATSFGEFSRNLNAGFLDNDRRASDTVLVQKPEILLQFHDSDPDWEMDPDDYHHFRRFSLNQEQPLEEYPHEDYIHISHFKIRTRSGSRTWTREDYYSEEREEELHRNEAKVPLETVDLEIVEGIGGPVNAEGEDDAGGEGDEEAAREEDDSNGSEDERQTVVEVDDEIDDDIVDFNEFEPADESHHEQSECEEADREFDRYAGRGANDWPEVPDGGQYVDQNEEGAAGGVLPDDSDSSAIDQIYGEAIKNRKQSGILRDYNTILEEMHTSCAEGLPGADDRSSFGRESRAMERPSDVAYSGDVLDRGRRATEVHYLSNETMTFGPSEHSTLLRFVELNFERKDEYNGPQDFRFDDETAKREDGEWSRGPNEGSEHVGGESATLLSRNREPVAETEEEERGKTQSKEEVVETETVENWEKTKKKKNRKKTRKDSRSGPNGSISKRDECGSENPIYNSPKRKSRSRRSSGNSLSKDETIALLSADITDKFCEEAETAEKPTRRGKGKSKELRAAGPKSRFGSGRVWGAEPVSTATSPGSVSLTSLSSPSPRESVCVTPATTESEEGATASASADDSPDNPKDATFYPLSSN